MPVLNAAVDVVIMGFLDRVAKGRQNSQANWTGGTTFWNRVDSAGDQLFENRIKGSTLTLLDQTLSAGGTWGASQLAQAFQLFPLYFQLDLLLNPATFAKYLSTSGWRMAYEANRAHFEALGYLPGPLAVFPKGTRPADLASPATAGMQRFGQLTGTAGAPTYASVDGALDTTQMIGSVVMIVNTDDTPAPSALVMNGIRADGITPLALPAITLGATTQYKQTLFGQQALSGNANAGQKVVPVAATAQFLAGEYVLLYHSDANQEIAQIDIVNTNANIVLKTNIIQGYVTSDLALPLFTNVSFGSGTLGNGKHLDFYAYPDRLIAL